MLKSSLRSLIVRDALNNKDMVTSKLTTQIEEHWPLEILERLIMIHFETSEEDEEMDRPAPILASDVGETVVLTRLLHTMEGPQAEN